MKKRFISAVLFVFLASGAASAQNVTLLKRLDDGGSDLALKIVQLFEGDTANPEKQRKMKPFAMGFFGWRAKHITLFGIGKIEAAHLNFCRVPINAYDRSIDATLSKIISRATSPVIWENISPEEKKAIHEFVVMKYGGEFAGFGVYDTNRKIDPTESYKYMLGMALGELGGKLVIWYKFPTYAPYPADVAKIIAGLDSSLKDIPPGTPPQLIERLRKLREYANKPAMTEAARDELAAEFKKTILAAMYWVDNRDPNAPFVSPRELGNQVKVAAELLARAKYFYQNKDYNSALADLNESIKLNAAESAAYYYRAKTLEELGQIDKAISDYNMMIAFKFDLPKAYYNRGTLWMEKKSFAMAISDFSEALKLDPKHANALYNRGLSYYNLARFNEAIADFSRSLLLQPKSKDTLIMRAFSYCQTGKTALALRDQEAVIKLGDNIPKGCGK